MSTMSATHSIRGGPPRPRGFRKGERGSTLLEFALVAPLLFLLVFAVVDFGNYFFVSHTLQFATREGVRLALVGGTINDAGGNAMSRLASMIATIEKNAAAGGIRASDLQISIYPLNSDYTEPAGAVGMQDAGQGGSIMRVRTRYEYQVITPIVHLMVKDGRIAAQAEATYRNELF
jgi:Flp pilus assembly protein TadG